MGAAAKGILRGRLLSVSQVRTRQASCLTPLDGTQRTRREKKQAKFCISVRSLTPSPQYISGKVNRKIKPKRVRKASLSGAQTWAVNSRHHHLLAALDPANPSEPRFPYL